MAPTPYSAGYQLDLHLAVGSVNHIIQLPCDATIASGVYQLTLWDGGSRLASAAADDFAQLLKIFYNSTSSFVQYVLQQFDSGIFIPRESAAMAVVGTDGANAEQHGFATTLTFRDLTYKVQRIIVPESTLPGPQKRGYPVTGLTGYNAFIESILPGSTATNPIGQWIRSRGDSRTNTFVKASTMTNKSIVRRRGL